MLCTRLLSKNAIGKWPLNPAINFTYQNFRNKNLQLTESNRQGSVINYLPLYVATCQFCSANSTSATLTAPENFTKEDTLLKRVLKKVGLTPNTQTRLRVSSRLLYESVADKINYLMFFKEFNLPNTFNSWFLVTELHVWMLLLRSMAEGSESGEDGRFMRNCIVESMWGDVNARAKKLGAANPSLTRQQIAELSEQFQAALIAYDEGIMSEDRVLAAALWRRFFSMNCSDYMKIERMVKYVRYQVNMLDKLSSKDFLYKPKLQWQKLDKIHV